MRAPIPPFVLLMLMLVLPASGVMITGFCPDTYAMDEPDEFIVLSGNGSLAGISITDGEGSIRFPDGASIAGRAVVARQAEGYLRVHGTLPDYEMMPTHPDVPDMIRSGDLRMANTQDSLNLLEDGVTVQEVAWPGMVAARQGQVHFLEDGAWDPHPRLIGQSDFAPETFENVSLTLFVSPDCSYEVVEAAIHSARYHINANLYEFTHPGIARMLAGALDRGVGLTILLEGGPVGGVPLEERAVARTLSGGGAAVMAMGTVGENHARYRFDHAKYMVIDNESVLLTTENFKESGIPECGRAGNRGWGVWVRDPAVAAYFNGVFRADSMGGDITPMAGGGEMVPADAVCRHPCFAPLTVEGARVTPVLSPETSALVLDLISGAEESIWIEQAYISNSTDGQPNRFLAAAIEAARRGVDVRVLLDSAWFNTADEEDNDEQAAWINALARAESLPLQARCADLEAAGLDKVHTKGVIVDNRSVLVSSMNWNDNSADFNREAGVIVDSTEAGRYFAGVFSADWESSSDAGEEIDVRLICAAAILAIFLAAAVIRRRRS
ncbi:phospholipase D-like domain-containing protein [Methanofollis fontis]|uniref:Phospholipase n=1 Tax=Methanofollis fontis TaxID=2052832 RepID=A0A483D017_9EURY|nr:phospholipase D-like domain-containing protein [Methanofollis fontis]TAJ45859.1 phospholipase [Methanofollis fontis]